jgi:hypothetical protein
MAPRKDVAERNALLSRYEKLYKDKYEIKPTYNRNIEQWAASDLIQSYTLEQCYSMLEFYFENSNRHDWSNFVYSADKINKAIFELNKDKRERFERRKMARKWLSE